MHHFKKQRNQSSCGYKRIDRTMKQLMWRMFTTTSSCHYLDKLDSLVNGNYNQSVHRSTKMNPADVNRFNAQDVWKTLFEKNLKPIKYKFNLGDQVKISKHKRIFKKGYLPSWTEETFTIAQRLPRDYSVYHLEEADGDFIQGNFYEQELQKVIETLDHLFHVKKVLKFRGKGANKEALVHWKGFPSKYYSWLPSKQLVVLQQA